MTALSVHTGHPLVLYGLLCTARLLLLLLVGSCRRRSSAACSHGRACLGRSSLSSAQLQSDATRTQLLPGLVYSSSLETPSLAAKSQTALDSSVGVRRICRSQRCKAMQSIPRLVAREFKTKVTTRKTGTKMSSTSTAFSRCMQGLVVLCYLRTDVQRPAVRQMT